MIGEIILTAFCAVLFLTGLAKLLNVDCWRGDVESMHNYFIDHCDFDEDGKCLIHENCIHDNSEVNFV